MGYNTEESAQPLKPVTTNSPPETGEESNHYANNPLSQNPQTAGNTANISLGTTPSQLTVVRSPLPVQSFASTPPPAQFSGNENSSVSSMTASDQVSLAPVKEWIDRQNHARYQSNPPHHSSQTVNPYGYNEHDVPNPFRANAFNTLPPNTWQYGQDAHHAYGAPQHTQFDAVPQSTSRENPFRHLNRSMGGSYRTNPPISYRSPYGLIADTGQSHSSSQHNQYADLRRVQLQEQALQSSPPSVLPQIQKWSVTPSLKTLQNTVSSKTNEGLGTSSLVNNDFDNQHIEDSLKSASSQNQQGFGNKSEASRQLTDLEPKGPQNQGKRNHSPEASPMSPPTAAPYFRQTHSAGVVDSKHLASKGGDPSQGYYRQIYAESLHSAPRKPSLTLKETPTMVDLDQSIVSNYGDYKWPVELYKINATNSGYTFAKHWLDDQLFKLDYDTTFKWFVHGTEGFLKDGDHLTFLTLHNAVNPFEYGVYSTTTTFGFYDSSPDGIIWKTIMPGLRSEVKQWEYSGAIQQVHQWHTSLKATEKRFHRAYWLAANMLPLGGLLNRAKPISELKDAKIYSERTNDNAPDALEFDDKDVTNQGIDISMAEAKQIWQRCLDELRSDLASVYQPSSVGLASSEWVP